MQHRTLGILIRRDSQADYNEKILFWTKHFGKLKLYSFGSRSSRSSRNKMLKSYDWLKIAFTRKGKSSELNTLELYRKNDFLSDLTSYHFFLESLKQIDRVLPDGIRDDAIFKLLYLYSRSEFQVKEKEISRFLFSFALLQITGFFPFFNGCRQCSKLCSPVYFSIVMKVHIRVQNAWEKPPKWHLIMRAWNI